MTSSRGRLSLLLLSTAVLYAGKIEYRQIPEYGGYFPVARSESEELQLRADWVLPTDAEDPAEIYRPPGSVAAAADRVKRYRGKKRRKKAIGSLAVPLLWLPGIATATEYYAHVPHERLDEETRRALEEFAGTEVSIHTVDGSGTGLPGALVYSAVYPQEIPTYLDGEGLRSFARQAATPYTPSSGWIAATIDHLPIYLGRFCGKHSRLRIGCSAREHLGVKSIFAHRSNEEGRVRLTNLAFARFSTFAPERGWRWADQPTPLTLHTIAWSPGYEATAGAALMAEPGSPVELTLVMKPLAASAEVRQAHREIERDLAAICEAVSYRARGRRSGWQVDTAVVSRAIGSLAEALRSPRLPRYLRWNVREILADLSRAAFAITAPVAAEARTTLLDTNVDQVGLTPAWRDGPRGGSPWELAARTALWLEDIEDGLQPHRRLTIWDKNGVTGVAGVPAEYLRPEGSVDVDPLADASALLLATQALDPRHPALESFRAAIALAAGDRGALPLTRFLNHGQFFGLFYEGLELRSPPMLYEHR